MTYYKNLFIGGTVTDLDETMRLLHNRTAVLGVYLVCIGKNLHYMLEIMHTTQIFKSGNKKNDYMVIGIANGRPEAFELVKGIFVWWAQTDRPFATKEFQNFFLEEEANDKR